MRHSSERVPGKNFKKLGGKPLFCWIIDSIKQVSEISQIIIDTDSQTIRSIATELYPDILCIERPKGLCAPDLSMNLVLENTIKFAENEFILQTHSTNPFLSSETLDGAIKYFLNTDRSKTVMSVQKIQARLWNKSHSPVNHNPHILQRTQDLEPIYLENSSFYLFSKKSFMENTSRLSEAFLHMEIGGLEGWDIDEPWQWDVAEKIANKMERN